MKPIKMFMMASCPYCRMALKWMDDLYAENNAYKTLKVEMIDELMHPEIANKYDYIKVPTYYVDEVKQHEGAASPEIIKRVFDMALAD